MSLLRLGLVPVLIAIAATRVSAGAGCDSRSEASQERISIDWVNEVEIAPTPSGKTGGTTEGAADPRPSRADKPMMVFVKHPDSRHHMMVKIEELIFKNEQIGIGAKFFETIDVSASDARKDPILREAGEETPRFVFLRRDYAVHAVLEGKQITPTKVLKAMKSLVKLEYETSFDKVVRAYSKLLDQLDLLQAREDRLTEQKARLDADAAPAKVRKLEREEADLEKDMERWEQAEEKVLAFELKEEKRA